MFDTTKASHELVGEYRAAAADGKKNVARLIEDLLKQRGDHHLLRDEPERAIPTPAPDQVPASAPEHAVPAPAPEETDGADLPDGTDGLDTTDD
jgi:hypothetical protein